MNGKKAKKIRKLIYGKEKESVQDRAYTELLGGTFVAVEERRAYKDAKKKFKKHLKVS